MKNENFGCKNCGGVMTYDPRSQNLKCENCGNEVELSKETSLNRHSLSGYSRRLKNIEREKSTIIECSSCGATIELSSEKTSGKCPYCNSNVVVAEKLISTLEPDGLRPFLIDRRKVEEIFSKWIGGRWFAPNALKTLHQRGKIMGIYLPFWSFDNNAYCRYSADGGIDYTVTYEENGETKTRTETRWYAVNGSLINEFQDIIVNATKSLDRNLLSGLKGFYTRKTLKFDLGYIAGYSSEVFGIEMPDGYEEAKFIMEGELKSLVEQEVLRRYDRVRDVRMDIDWSDEYYRLLMLPVYSTSYSYNSKPYQVLINGENGEIIGEYPKSVIKITLAIIAAVIVLAVIFYLYKGS